MRRRAARALGLAAPLALAAALGSAGSASAQVAREARDGPTQGRGEAAVERTVEPLSVRAVFSVDRAVVPIVDDVRAVLAVEAPPWILVTFPRVVGEIGAFRLMREEKAGPFPVPSERGERLVRNERRYRLDPTEAGEMEIRAVTLNLLDGRTVPSIACVYLNECRGADPGDARAAATEFLRIGPLPVEVTSVLPPDADFTKPKGILGPVPLPPPPPAPFDWGPLLAAGAAAFALAAAAFALFRLRRRGGRARSPAMAAAHAMALDALRRLDASGLDTPEKVAAFYTRVSAILRHYLDWRFGLRAPERTTEEVLREAAAGRATAGHGAVLGAFLGLCDRVKFARHRPGPGAPAAALASAVGFVRETADAAALAPAARAAEVR